MCSRNLPGADLYAALRVEPNATVSDLRTAYRRAALLTHPDKGGSHESFLAVTLAFEVLGNEETRARYDDRLRKNFATEKRCGNVCKKGRPSAQHPSKVAGASTGKDALASDSSVNVALAKLCNVLKMLSIERRRATLEKLDHHLRVRLAAFIEKSKDRSTSSQSLWLSELYASSMTDSSSSEDSGEDDFMAEPVALENVESTYLWETRPVDCSRIVFPKEYKRVQKGIVQVHGGLSTSYLAMLMFGHLVFYTKCVPNLETAVDHHILLVQMRSRSHLTKGGSWIAGESDSMLSACREVLSRSGTSVEEMGLRAAVRLEFGGIKLHRRKIFINSPVLPLEEVLLWRDRLLSSRDLGWNEFHKVWIDLLQHPGYKHKRALNASEAIAFVESKRAVIEALLERMLARRERKERNAELRVESQLQRALKLLRHALDRERAARWRAKRKKDMEDARVHKQLRFARNAWLKRKSWRDMTMDDLMAEIPI